MCDCEKKKPEEIFSEFKGESHELIPLLQRVQEEYSYLPEDVMLKISEFIGEPASKIFAVASFYHMFRFTPMGKNRVMVCRGTACHVRGASRIQEEVERQLGIKEGETTEDGEYTMETVACIGCCALAPCVMVNDNVEANLTPKKVIEIFKERS